MTRTIASIPNQCVPAGWAVRTIILFFFRTAAGQDFDVGDEYGEILGECGGGLWQRTGVFTSPGFPEGYPSDSFCFWEILAPDHYLIEVDFQEFDIGWSEFDCHRDRVVVMDTNTFEIARLCGSTKPSRIRSNGQKLTFGLVADGLEEGKGFKANYSMLKDPIAMEPVEKPKYVSSKYPPRYEGCGGTISDISAVITSPGYPAGYPPYSSCIWEIVPPPGNHIYLTFDVFDLDKRDDQCDRDYVDVLDSSANIILRLCGATRPEMVLTCAQKMTIIMKTDSKEGGNGFVVSYSNIKPDDDNTMFMGTLDTPARHVEL